MSYKRFKVWKFRVNENNEIISCSASRGFSDRESAMRFFNKCKNADFFDYETEEEIKKRVDKII